MVQGRPLIRPSAARIIKRIIVGISRMTRTRNRHRVDVFTTIFIRRFIHSEAIHHGNPYLAAVIDAEEPASRNWSRRCRSGHRPRRAQPLLGVGAETERLVALMQAGVPVQTVSSGDEGAAGRCARPSLRMMKARRCSASARSHSRPARSAGGICG